MSTDRVKKLFAICMTGISGSGKTTIANAVSNCLKKRGVSVEVLDGDETRSIVGDIFGHSKEERLKMSRINQAIGFYLLRNKVSIILAAVAPYEAIRSQFRHFFGVNYIEVYVKASLATCAKRDTKGLYELSSKGELENLNGSNDIFEPPGNSDIIIDTERLSVEESCAMVIEYLYDNKYIN